MQVELREEMQGWWKHGFSPIIQRDKVHKAGKMQRQILIKRSPGLLGWPHGCYK